MKKYFMGGLVILLPLLVTAIVVIFLVNFLTRPFLAFTESFLSKLSFFQSTWPILADPTVILILSKVLILVTLGVFISLVGICAEHFFINAMLRLGNHFLHKLPVINRVYKTSQDIVHSLFASSHNKSSQVVFIPFPQPEQLGLGLVANSPIALKQNSGEQQELFPVFVPALPNPSFGFILLFKKEQLVSVDMSVDDAMKCIVSCGAVIPNFAIIEKHL